jgi:hypothetical protein
MVSIRAYVSNSIVTSLIYGGAGALTYSSMHKRRIKSGLKMNTLTTIS